MKILICIMDKKSIRPLIKDQTGDVFEMSFHFIQFALLLRNYNLYLIFSNSKYYLSAILRVILKYHDDS